MDIGKLRSCVSSSAFSFRGYDISNLGRSAELLTHPVYGPTLREWLEKADNACAEIRGRKMDLVDRVKEGRETTLQTYPDAIALLMAVEIAQLRMLREFFGIEYLAAQVAFGYSMGEIAALVASGVLEFEEALQMPLPLVDDSIHLAGDVTLGVLFSRDKQLPLDQVHRLCLQINSERRGMIGVSAYLSPNSVVLMGQADTLDRLQARLPGLVSQRLYLRKKEHRWPPLHTPIVWQRNIPDRFALRLHTMRGGMSAPTPPILSMVTGEASYNDYNARDLMRRWIDHPQRLWDVVYKTLAMGVDTVIHVGPQPSITLATFKRLADNVEAQVKQHLGMRALSGFANRPWLKSLLPARTALLRAPLIQHVVLEDWLLDQNPP
jgi:[acyl-carrier-protein] S-malonyltransferase